MGNSDAAAAADDDDNKVFVVVLVTVVVVTISISLTVHSPINHTPSAAVTYAFIVAENMGNGCANNIRYHLGNHFGNNDINTFNADCCIFCC